MFGSKVFKKKIGFALPVFKKRWSDSQYFKKDDRIRSISKKRIGFTVVKKRWSDSQYLEKDDRSWSRSWPGADEKILVSGAGQKRTSSATLNQTSVATIVSDPHSSNPGPDPTGVYYWQFLHGPLYFLHKIYCNCQK